MHSSKKIYADHMSDSMSPTLVWNILVTFIQIELPGSKSELTLLYDKMLPALRELTTNRLPESDELFKELKYRHLVKIAKKKNGPAVTDHYEQIETGNDRLKWDLKQLKNHLNLEGVTVRKNEKAVCLFCGSDCRSGHNFCEHLRGKNHAQKVIELWKLVSELKEKKSIASDPSHCVVCDVDIGKFDYQFEAHQRSRNHQSKLLQFIGMPYCELCGCYVKYGMKVHQNLPIHAEMARALKKKYDSPPRKLASSFDKVPVDKSGGSVELVHGLSLKVSDPCKSAQTIRTTVGVQNEIQIQITNFGETEIRLEDCILNATEYWIFGMYAPGVNLPQTLNPSQSFNVHIRMLADMSGFYRAQFVVKISETKEIVRDLRYLCLPPIKLEDLEDELTRLNKQAGRALPVINENRSQDVICNENNVSRNIAECDPDEELAARLQVNL